MSLSENVVSWLGERLGLPQLEQYLKVGINMMAALDDKLNTLQTTIEGIHTKLDGIQTAVSNEATEVSELQQSLEELKQQLGGNVPALDAAIERLTAVGGRLDQLGGEIAGVVPNPPTGEETPVVVDGSVEVPTESFEPIQPSPDVLGEPPLAPGEEGLE